MTLRSLRPGTRDGVSGRFRGRPPVVSAGPAAALLLVLAAGAGCSGEDEPASPDPAPSGSGPSDATTTTTLGRVTGELARARGTAARDEVGSVVDRWFAAAYLGQDGPPDDAERAFPGFTRGAAAQARADRALTTNLALPSGVQDVVERRGEVVVDLLATGGRARAATARFVLVTDLGGETERTERVAGRLYLTPDQARGGPGWQVIGYDVERGRQR